MTSQTPQSPSETQTPETQRPETQRPESHRPHIFVMGNEKGGSGKSTTSLHLSVSLLKRGYSVGCIDLDARQGTLSRTIENRIAYAKDSGLALEIPEHRRVYRSEAETKSQAEAEDRANLGQAVDELWALDCLVIDTPGSDNYLSRLGHTYADTLITPLNDSFLDLDLLARIDREGQKILSPSVYSQMVWEQRQRRAMAGGKPIDWIVMRNRLSHIDARNKREIGRLLDMLAKRIQFRLAPGFGERVIFRELFPKGLTLLDLREKGNGVALNMSHVSARQEVRALLKAIGLPDTGEAEASSKQAASGTQAASDSGEPAEPPLERVAAAE